MTKRLLIVDDEPGLRTMLAANLELEGYEVVEAESAERALEIMAAETFDVVITDIRMPGMNGVELFRRLRELGKRMPLVLMTAFAEEALVKSALEEGAFTLLSKPFDVDHAIRTVGNAARTPVVLVVDDVRSVAQSTSDALEASGVPARPAFSGAEALELLRAGAIDVCVIDLVMPGMSGVELASAIRKLEGSVVVIAVSGEDVPEMIRQVAEHGMHTFLQKPVGIRELVRSIGLARSEPAPTKGPPAR